MLFAGKMQHSVWVVEIINSNLEVSNTNLLDEIPSGVLPKQFSFRRIWQGKGVQTAAFKVLPSSSSSSSSFFFFFFFFFPGNFLYFCFLLSVRMVFCKTLLIFSTFS